VNDPSLPEPNPGDNPFAAIPFIGDLMRMAGQQGPMSWDTARQIAFSLSSGGSSEANVEPIERIRYEELARIAQLHLAQATGFDLEGLKVVPVNRTGWANQALEDWRPLLERLATSLGKGPAAAAATDPADPADAFAGMFASLSRMVAPMWLGMATGSMVGHLSERAMGTYHLPLPRGASSPLQVVVPNVNAFADDWSIERDDLRMWVSLSEMAHHAILRLPHVRARLNEQLGRFVDAFEPNPSALEAKFGQIDPSMLNDPSGLQKLFGDPELLLGAVRSPAQVEMLDHTDALLATIVCYVDRILDEIVPRLLGASTRLAEALRRRRVEEEAADRFVQKLLGIELDQASYDRAAAFLTGVVERAGAAALGRLWESERTLPTPTDLEAPGLWLARLEFDD